jgi:hypothetical protein
VKTLAIGEVDPPVREGDEWVVHTAALSYVSRLTVRRVSGATAVGGHCEAVQAATGGDQRAGESELSGETAGAPRLCLVSGAGLPAWQWQRGERQQAGGGAVPEGGRDALGARPCQSDGGAAYGRL